MRKLAPIILFLLALTACSPSLDYPLISSAREEVAPEETIFYATLEGSGTPDPQTKVFADNQLHVLWNADDLVSIFNLNATNQQYRFDGIDGANAGTFSVVPPLLSPGSDLSHIYAVYPYREGTSVSGNGVISTEFPATQSYKENSFGIGANTMVSMSDDNQLMFRNVGSYLCLKLYGENYSVRSIILKGNRDNDTLAGPICITLDANKIPSMHFDKDRPGLSNTITLTTKTPVPLGAIPSMAVHFWMVVPPVTLPNGFTVTIIDSEGGIHEKSTAKPITFERSHLSAMQPFELEAVTPEILPEGWYYLQEPRYEYNNENGDQVNIVESEGNAWVRFLLVPDLIFLELGPIPIDSHIGDRFNSVLTLNQREIVRESYNYHFTVQNVENGLVTLLSDDGYRFVFRF